MTVATLAGQADRMLRGDRAVPLGILLVFVVLGAGTYGAFMGTFGGVRWQILYAALKVPLLIATSSLVCLPSFYVFHLLLGLGREFPYALRAVAAGQATLAVCLASLAPFVAVAYLSIESYPLSVLLHGVPFLLATIGAQLTIARHYAPLEAGNPRHRYTRRLWFGLYVFVAMQSAWVLRPFVGSPDLPVRFFREEAWDNAYVRIFESVWRLFR